MKKLLFAGAILFGTFTFANTGNSQDLQKNILNSSTPLKVSSELFQENLKEAKIIDNSRSIVKPRGYVTIEFDINCGGQVGHMTVTYLSDNSGGWGAIIEIANAINQGTIQGCQQMASHGLI